MEALTGTPSEGVPIVRRGFVARIQNSNDFFIALDDHEEWGHSFTVFGDMRDDVFGLESLEKIATMPFREQKAAGSETVMRLLNEEIEVNARIIGGDRSSEVPASFEL
jgi:cyclophilin family peptidyl-prolyl cis-trans isomerase